MPERGLSLRKAGFIPQTASYTYTTNPPECHNHPITEYPSTYCRSLTRDAVLKSTSHVVVIILLLGLAVLTVRIISESNKLLVEKNILLLLLVFTALKRISGKHSACGYHHLPFCMFGLACLVVVLAAAETRRGEAMQCFIHSGLWTVVARSSSKHATGRLIKLLLISLTNVSPYPT